ncbi:hypothetical protein HETIRDRAFT_435557 [Heterobasidion irregulare TC 32-1]|uniref:pyridoxal kinase n=1 Tax=Heterobasidion irregulare (strain TC 32-1) TaxID=747525 RepID=W4K1T3_HETIT|nr:uncharacterized protein HETIRDRAFT_435557 [Heterobasidion irregulare TC 32-1]ETW79061.1 hypothetical protein HETIRDRAFT_435557 [Heterobasidion irregulare TC 32-1]
MSHQDPGRVLSIQSHVSFGYVGGKAAVFPLQLLGYDVDVINTVNFSNHSGYRRLGGSKAQADDITALLEAMEQNGFLRPSRLLTGYVPGAAALSVVADLAVKLRKQNPELIYLLDPVIGDAGRMYVAPDVIPIYRTLLPHSTIITPNWFEVEVLTDIKIEDTASLHNALTILHKTYAVPNVIISSIPLQLWLIDILPAHIHPLVHEDALTPEFLLCITSSYKGEGTHTPSTPNISTVHAGYVPLIPGYFSGVGDLFSALVLAHFSPTPSPPFHSNSSSKFPTPLAHATSLALTKTHAILQRTYEYSSSLPEEERLETDEELDAQDPERRIRRMKGRELRLIQGQDILKGDALKNLRAMEEWVNFWG